MPQPEYVFSSGLRFLSADGEAVLREQLERYHDILDKIAHDAQLTPQQIRDLASQALAEDSSQQSA